MGFAIASALRLSTRLTSQASSSPSSSSSGLLLLYLSTSSLLAHAASPRTASFQSQRTLSSLPTCPINKATCPAISGVRSFHSSSHNWSSTTQFSYHVAASYSAKGNRFNADKNTFTRDVFDPAESGFLSFKECKASSGKRARPKSGQDAFFFSQVGTTRTTAFGVADGVGGWVESGVDPADFSHGLCEYMACAARMWPQGARSNSLHPKDLLQAGYDEVMVDRGIVGGGSTACLAVAEPDGNVEVANLGDSGFMHLGLNAVRHFTQPQTHAFNTPYQLSKTPERMLVQMAVFGGTSALSDLPKESNVTHHLVRHGDVLIFATDGVWDNLSPQDALSIVSRSMIDLGAWEEKDGVLEVGPDLPKLTQATRDRKADNDSLQAKLAIAIAKEAKETSLNTRRDGPFAKEVQKNFPVQDNEPMFK
ncbi:5-azacytidine resistance protein-like protein azr1 [Lindgomyces ingoldianus]|uniref:5-azacytidine resistance protein-like protein azr1 n=1 Tax=Lindgomyces ingoldianus TaxID=673940 RepID=A0ACB6QPW5_9PLEO|nr:5-azacytidine resistance protein-like protein azr1 [Lindgomyces ingoldianus]KAF2468142.1 5-azacytidine resistance protein-like protein azr1 [Lindgomyces ingoldianus]